MVVGAVEVRVDLIEKTPANDYGDKLKLFQALSSWHILRSTCNLVQGRQIDKSCDTLP